MTDIAQQHKILFEPVSIGPVTAPNRFYQTPHSNGMGHRYPETMAAMRQMKAEGGWGTVCTEECEIHPSSDLSSATLMRLWDDSDIHVHANMIEKVHSQGALAGIELTHNGPNTGNYFSRCVPIAPSDIPCLYDPYQARQMNKKDIREFREWHKKAAIRAKLAGYDIIYTYAGHDMNLLMKFLLPRYNRRSDEYGGSLKNRVRLLKEVLSDTKDAVGDSCAVALRFAVDELLGSDGLRCEEEGREIVSMLAEIPDLWDVNLSAWENDTQASRWAKEGYQQPFTQFVKELTNKPVVGVGRFTSPDTMASLVRQGALDLVGAARPSIADPFLPEKIRTGRTDEIRECIGCNMCTVGDFTGTPIRCTQNPTMGEEYRKGWHPEIIATAKSKDRVLVIGAGPSGLECSLALANRGYQVVLAEKSNELGGRVLRESQQLPGLQEWSRVIDYRSVLLKRHANVEIYFGSDLSSQDIKEFGFERVIIATGSTWRADGIGRSHYQPIPNDGSCVELSAESLLDGELPAPATKVAIYDGDHYYMANCLAEKLALHGCEVVYVTAEDSVAGWTEQTLEHERIHTRLLELDVELQLSQSPKEVLNGQLLLECSYTSRIKKHDVDAVLWVTSRSPRNSLYQDYLATPETYHQAGIKELICIGDSDAPGTIAQAVYAGHQAARQLDTDEDLATTFKRENYGRLLENN